MTPREPGRPAERERPLQVAEDEQEVQRGDRVEATLEQAVERTVELDPHERWRGVGVNSGSDDADVDRTGSRFLRQRSRRLLGSLLSPYKGWVAIMVLVVLVENAARLSIPLLVARGIDRGLPPIMDGGSPRTLLEIVAAMLVAVVLQSLGRTAFLRVSGRIGQDVLLELRRRVF